MTRVSILVLPNDGVHGCPAFQTRSSSKGTHTNVHVAPTPAADDTPRATPATFASQTHTLRTSKLSTYTYHPLPNKHFAEPPSSCAFEDSGRWKLTSAHAPALSVCGCRRRVSGKSLPRLLQGPSSLQRTLPWPERSSGQISDESRSAALIRR